VTISILRLSLAGISGDLFVKNDPIAGVQRRIFISLISEILLEAARQLLYFFTELALFQFFRRIANYRILFII